LLLSCGKQETPEAPLFDWMARDYYVAIDNGHLPRLAVVKFRNDHVMVGDVRYEASYLDFGTVISNMLPCGEQYIYPAYETSAGDVYLKVQDCAGNRVYLGTKY
jgi:hypothetical protein